MNNRFSEEDGQAFLKFCEHVEKIQQEICRDGLEEQPAVEHDSNSTMQQQINSISFGKCGDCFKILPRNHWICGACASKRVCTLCHRGLRDIRFSSAESSVCDTCLRKNNQKGLGMNDLRKLVSSHDIDGNDCCLELFINKNMGNITEILEKELQKKGNVKWYLSLIVKYQRAITDGQSKIEARFVTHPEVLLNPHQINDQILDFLQLLEHRNETFVSMGSGWVLENVDGLRVHIAKYEPVRASQYIKSPTFIANTRAVINIKNSDDYCFKWCIMAFLKPVNVNRDRVSNYTKLPCELNLDGLEFPMMVDQISEFELKNPQISVSVLHIVDEDVAPYRVTRFRNRQHHINLLLLTEKDTTTGCTKYHYTLVSDLERLLKHKSKHTRHCYACKYCFELFTCSSALDKHRLLKCRGSDDIEKSDSSCYVHLDGDYSKILLNIENNDYLSFAYCCLAAIHPVERDATNVEHYKKYLSELNLHGLTFPLTVDQFKKFEKNNKDISLCILYYFTDESGCRYLTPVHTTSYTTNIPRRKHHICLFMNYKNETIPHYNLIVNLNKFVHCTKSDHYSHTCGYCLHRFSKSSLLDQHLAFCGQHDACRIVFPSSSKSNMAEDSVDKDMEHVETIEELLEIDQNLTVEEQRFIRKKQQEYSTEEEVDSENILKFKMYKALHAVPFIIYADFECFVITDQNGKQYHEPSGFCAFRVGRFSNKNYSEDCFKKKPYVYSGDKVMQHFFQYLVDEDEEISQILSGNKPMSPLTESQIQEFNRATHCPSCNELFGIKYRHHDHVTGEYVGPLCNRCNLQMKPIQRKNIMNKYKRKREDGPSNDFFIPVVFHNAKGYDLHLIFKHLDRSLLEDKQLSVIAVNSEQYVTASIGNIKIIDSCQFLPSTLESLIDTLKRDDKNKFSNTKEYFENEHKFNLILRKGIFPYEYLDNFMKFLDTKLPTKDHFYSKLNESDCSDTDYEHALNIWTTFGCKTLQDYHDLYMMTDVLLLSDIFEDFRSFCLKHYKLDPGHFPTSPSLSFNACLRMTKAKIELLTDIDMLLFFEASIRGGVSKIVHRHAVANNKYMKNFDPNQPSIYIQYFDINNLYGWSMSQPLPVGEFRWLTPDEINSTDFLNVPDDSEYGYMLEVDIEYPEHLHDDHNELPLCPDKIVVLDEFLSPFQLRLKQETSSRTGSNIKKLVPNFFNKKNYILHYRNFKYYIEKGLKATKIHRVISFKQQPWIKEYIEFNTKMRQQADSSSQKNFFKFLNNSIYGRTLMNLRKQTNVFFTTNETSARNKIAKPEFKSFHLINDDLIAIELKKSLIKWDKPSFSGCCILELSKLLLYQYHYDVFKNKYGNKATLLFTDTDSLCYKIETEDLYEDMLDYMQYMDTANFPPEHSRFSLQNDRKIGFLKDECSSKQPEEFVGIRSKMYSIKMPEDEKDKITAKGVKRCFVKNHISHDDFVNSLFGNEKTRAQFYNIRSRNHQLYTEFIEKDALNPFDNKRYILDDGITTLAFGHHKIKNL